MSAASGSCSRAIQNRCGSTTRDIRPPDQVSLLRQSIAIPDVLQRSGPWVHGTKDGSIIEVEATSHILKFSGRKARFVMAQEVAERRRPECQLNQVRRLESLGQLAGGVAHDFNNLLAVILNFVQFSMAKVSAVANATNNAGLAGAVKDLERVERAAKSAANLTLQLLTFARHEVVQPRVVEINSVIGELEPLLRRTLGEHIEVRTEMGVELWPVLIDKGQLEQILMNLSVNARHAMEVGGRLTSIRRMSMWTRSTQPAGWDCRPGRYVRLRVSDSGTGMDADTLQHAFEPFFTTKPKGEGTGLGLATVHGIVNQAGGYVSIYTEPGWARGSPSYCPSPT